MKQLSRQLAFLLSKRDLLHFLAILPLLVSVGIVEILSLGTVPLYVSAITGRLGSLRQFQALPARLQAACQDPFLFSVLFFLLFLLRTAYLLGTTRLQFHMLSNRKLALTSLVYRRLLEAPYALLLDHSQAALQQSIVVHTYDIAFQILAGLLTLARDLFLILLIAALTVSYDALLSILAILFLTATCGIYMLGRSAVQKANGIRRDACQREILATVNETLRAVPEIRIYHLQGRFQRLLRRAVDQNSRCEGSILLHNCILWPILEILTLFSLLAAMLITMSCRHKTPLDLAPSLILLTVSLTRIKGLYTESMLALNNLLNFRPSLDRTCELLRQLPEDKSPASPPPAASPAGEPAPFRALELRDVVFSYRPGGPPNLDRVSLTVERGQSIGIRGRTGCGKSTLLLTILGLLRPDRGSVRVDGRDLQEVLPRWQARIGYVPQSIALFDRSIRENIALGEDSGSIDPERMRRAIRAAQLEDCLRTRPEGADARIGEQGARLSGGERQRIGIARALYRDPEILVFDEATSALDAQTEQAVADTIAALRGSVTMIIVAHRPAALRNCDRIITMAGGRIVDDAPAP